MASLGEKIKGVLTGHTTDSQQETTDNRKSDTTTTPGAWPEDKHTNKDTELHNKLHNATETKTEHGHRDSGIDFNKSHHHDPEQEAQQATSAAGNFPYWGDLPRDGEHSTGSHEGHTHGTGSGAAGAIGTGGVTGSQRSTGATHDRTGLDLGSGQTGQTRQTSMPYDTTTGSSDNRKHEHEALGAGAGLAGLGGAGYLASRNKNDEKSSNLDSTHSRGQVGHGRLDPGYAETQSTQNPGSYNTSSAGTTSSQRGLQDNSHKREEVATGAGLAGLGGAGYLASRNKHDQHETYLEDRSTTTGLASSSSPTTRGSTSGLTSKSHHNPTLEAQQATSAAGNYPHLGSSSQASPTTGGGIHNTVVGAGSTNAPSSHRGALDSSTTTTGGSHTSAGTFGQHQTTAGDYGASRSGGDRDRQGLAAVAGVGAGAGVLGAEEKHRHHHHDERPHDTSTSHSTHTSNNPTGDFYHNQRMQAGQTNLEPTHTGHHQPAQAAALQAWNKQDHPASTGAADTDRSRFDTAAVGTATGVAGAGATAAYYGQGREHEQSPRSNESEKIADRALGGDGTSHVSSNQGRGHGALGTGSHDVQHTSANTGYGSAGHSSVPGSLASGLAGSGQNVGSNVIHKCHQCGADNDISQYFKKDAAFRSGS